MTRMMRPPTSLPAVYLYRDPIDFRKSYRGLAAIVELELGNNLFDGTLYAFTNRHRNRIKCLFWEVCKHWHTFHDVFLFKTNIGHAGEWLEEVLQHRNATLDPPTVMSDALSHNKTVIAKVLRTLCNSHCTKPLARYWLLLALTSTLA